MDCCRWTGCCTSSSCRSTKPIDTSENYLTMPAREPIPVGELNLATAALVHPLDEFYRQMGRALPPLQQVDGEAVPQPYKQLLVHHDDMTPTLEKYHGRDIHLRLLGRRRKGSSYFREVVLLLDGTDQPVEFGAIKIDLDRILHECGVKHSSRPKAFLRLASDHFINDALQLTGANVLYGRRNTLFDLQERPLAEIVE